jgi:hypothetical protein
VFPLRLVDLGGKVDFFPTSGIRAKGSNSGIIAKMMTGSKFEVERFDGKNNFNIWKSTVEDILVQQGLYKALQGKRPEGMKDADWEELEAKTVSTIRLALAPEVKYSVLNEKSASKLWKTLEDLYMSKSLTNRLYLKKQLYELKMDDDIDVRDHLNKFNKCVTELLNVDVKIEDEDKAIMLLSSLPKSYETLVTTLLVGKSTLTVNEVSTALLETANMKKPSGNVNGDQVLLTTSGNRYGRGESRGRNYGQRDRSQSRPRRDVECYYCHKKGHVRRDCEELTKHLDSKRKSKEITENSDSTNLVEENYDLEDALCVANDESLVSNWFLDSGCFYHMSPNRDWFENYKPCDERYIFVADNQKLEVKGSGTVKVKMFDGVVRRITGVLHVPRLKRNLISLGALDTLDYEYCAKCCMMIVKKNSVPIIRGEKIGNLYKLIGKTILGGAARLESHRGESSTITKVCEVAKMGSVANGVKVEESSSKISKRKVTFDESLNTVHVY